MEVAPTDHKSVLWVRQIIRIAAALGVTLNATAIDDDAVGILVVKFRDRTRHIVVLFQGVVINPADGLVWDLDAYLATSRAKINCFLQ